MGALGARVVPAASARLGPVRLARVGSLLAQPLPVWLLVALAIASLQAACGPTVDDDGLATTGAGPVGGISGEAMLTSDVESTDDEPWAHAVLFAVPFDEADALWAAGSLEPPLELERVMVALPQAALDEVGAVTAETDAAGKFHLGLDAGGYLVCLGQPDDDRVATVGCGQIAAPALDIAVSTGEAGFTVER